jgi:hypothetical protein
MTPVIELTSSNPFIGINIWPTSDGPEADLILRYLLAKSTTLQEKQLFYSFLWKRRVILYFQL